MAEEVEPSPLLETKLYAPRPRPGAVPRPRLTERLNRGAESKLTLISAPAGFGKTTLVAEWLAAGPVDQRPVAWLSLDQSDNEPTSFGQSMDVARLHGPHDVRVAREAVPVPGAGDELVQITMVGLCGSDLHWFDDGRIGATRLADPLVLGHEAVGLIASGPRRGTRVALEPAAPCGVCSTCLNGRGWLCPRGRFAGHTPVDGALREFMAWPASLLVPLPDTIADPDAALLEPLGVALHALDLAGVAPGMRAAVVGCGPIGLLIILALRAAGVTSIAATDPLEHRRRAAAEGGAKAVTASDAPADVDVAFDASGEPGVVAAAVGAVRPAGRVVLVGIPGADVTAFPAVIARRKELALVVCRRMTADDMPRAIAPVADGRIRLDGLVSGRFTLADAPAAFAALAERRGLKIVVGPGAAA